MPSMQMALHNLMGLERRGPTGQLRCQVMPAQTCAIAAELCPDAIDARLAGSAAPACPL